LLAEKASAHVVVDSNDFKATRFSKENGRLGADETR